MYQELIINGNTNRIRKAFFMDGFFSNTRPTFFHKHNYHEIHVIANGSAVFSIADRLFTASSGTIMIIPPDIHHCLLSKVDSTLCTAFQIESEVENFSVQNISAVTIIDFIKEINKCKTTQNYTKIAAYISLFCSYFDIEEMLTAKPITDYGFLIREFFSIHYRDDVHLSDLADILHVSERQAERLVIEYTGRSFRDELVAVRINIARNLLKSSNMSMKEISQYVGYKSYSGFWKAMNKA